MRFHRVPSLEPNAWTRAIDARRAEGARLVDLTIGNPTRADLGHETVPWLRALSDPAGIHYDPDPRGLRTAREAVAALQGDHGTPVPADRIVLTAGTSEAYAHLFRMLAEPGDCVLAPAPGYPMFGPIAALEGIRVEPYRLAWDGAWHLDLADLDRALALEPRAVIVVQPHVPTGACLDAHDREALIARCAARGIPIVADQVFDEFPWPPRRGILPGFAGETRVLTFALGGLSKTCGLPQLKLSWICVSGPEDVTREALETLDWISDLFLTVGTPVQLAARALLETRHAFGARVTERLGSNLARLDTLQERVPEISRLGGEGGWSAVLRLPARRTGEAWALALLARDVVVHPGAFYDLEGEAHLVVSLLTPPADLEPGLERIAEIVSRG